MANWMTVAEISARYIVGEQKLHAFAARGNMPMLRGPDGITRFDADHAALLFRPRDPSVEIAMPTDGKPNMGVLGVTRLGDKPATTPRDLRATEPGVRHAHRRALHVREMEQEEAATGLG